MEGEIKANKIKEGLGLEVGAENAPIKDIPWNTAGIETETVPIIDPGVGQEHVLRHFFFKSTPLPKGMKQPTKLEIINSFKRLIEVSLWSDGLIIREDKPIELHTRKSVKKVSRSLYVKMIEEDADFCILVLAYPRGLQTVMDIAHKAT